MLTNLRSKKDIDISCNIIQGNLRNTLGEISITLNFDLNMYLTRNEAELIMAALRRAIFILDFEDKTGEEE